MTQPEKELEAKFAVRHLAHVREKLLASGARLRRSRLLERNWRFDRPERELTDEGKVLRLRQDDKTDLTFKRSTSDPLQRTEINVSVEEPEAARRLLEALGYEVMTVYEKYREVFVLDQVEVMLDELPFGTFVEIEAPDRFTLEAAAERLELLWDGRVQESYLELFLRLKDERGLEAREATFAAFDDLPALAPHDLGLTDASARQEPQT